MGAAAGRPVQCFDLHHANAAGDRGLLAQRNRVDVLFIDLIAKDGPVFGDDSLREIENAAETRFRLLNHGRDLRGIGDVGLDGQRVHAQGLGFQRGDARGLGRRSIIDDNMRAGAGQSQGDGLAHPMRAPCYQCDFVFWIHECLGDGGGVF